MRNYYVHILTNNSGTLYVGMMDNLAAAWRAEGQTVKARGDAIMTVQ